MIPAGGVPRRPDLHRRQRLTGVLLVLVMALTASLVSGCAMGSDTRVRPGLEVGGAEAPQVRVLPAGPVAGAEPEQIIRGFLRAGAASDGDYASARDFLTEDAARKWQPDGGLVIVSTESELVIEAISEGRYRVSAPLRARIDVHGRYVAATEGERAESEVQFARIQDQWRIAGLPEDFGRWIASAEVRRLIRPYAVHYVTEDRRTLVEDLRWFPLDHLTSRLARAQLDPVPADLAGVATTAVPAGTRLAADSVSVTSGVATVELNARLPADQALRQNLWAQFTATLTQDPTVVAVALRADGASIDLPGVAAPVSDPSQVGFVAATTVLNAPMMVRRGEDVVSFDPGAAASLGDPKPSPSGESSFPKIPQTWTGLSLSADSRELAGVSRDRAQVVRFRGKDRYEVQGAVGGGLSDPTYDPRGFLWVAAASIDGTASPISAVNLAENPQTAVARPVAISWLEGRVVRALRVSPDTARVAVLSQARDGTFTVDVAGIQRGAAGVPTALSEPVRVSGQASDLRGLTWVSSTVVATLAAVPDNGVQPLLMSLDGSSSTLPAVIDGVALITPSGERQMMVRTRGDEIQVRAGQLWVSAGPGTDLLVPGR